MAALAAILQAAPVFLTEAAVALTVFSALPIYIAARLNPVTGILSYLAAFFVILFLSSHEALFFLCTNGVVGLGLGSLRYYRRKKPVTVLLSSAALTISLSIMNYGIGIPVFGTAIPGTWQLQLFLLYLFSAIYSMIYLYFAEFICKRFRISELKEK